MAEIIAAVEATGDDVLVGKFHSAVDVVERTIELYGLKGVAFSFNGGKDSTLLLHIIRAAVHKHLEKGGAEASAAQGKGSGLGGVRSFFFEVKGDFKEIRDFTLHTDSKYDLGMELITTSFKEGLEEFVNRTQVKAMFLGTRRTDPNAADQDVFSPSSKGWPAFMRVNPVMDWEYTDVWRFLGAAGVEYCSLYDQGYTSIGTVENTVPNALLQREDGTHAPAYELMDGSHERSGRSASYSGGGGGSKLKLPCHPGAGVTLTASLLIVGDEITSGRVRDENAHFLCRELYALGWTVLEVAIIRDDVSAVSRAVRRMVAASDIVITAGGIGPTPDDVTMAGVAAALGRPLVRHEALEERIRGYFGDRLLEGHLKMAQMPEGLAELIDDPPSSPGGTPRQPEATSPTGKSAFPLLKCGNVFVLPGIPHLLVSKFEVLRGVLREKQPVGQFHTVKVLLRMPTYSEPEVAPTLKRAVLAAGGDCCVGSYPVERGEDGVGIVLHVEGKDMARVEDVRDVLLAELPEGCVAGVEAGAANSTR